MAQKINLEEILNDCAYVDDDIKPNIKNAMKEAVRQALELAAENAEICEELFIVDKQSILNTINQVE